MDPLIWAELASFDATLLFSWVADIIAAALSAEHVVVQEINAVHTDSRHSASAGWGTGTTSGFTTVLFESLLQPTMGELEDSTVGNSGPFGGIYVCSPAFLKKYKLACGMFLNVACQQGALAVFAGRSTPAPHFNEKDTKLLCAAVNLLRATIERRRDNLTHPREISQLIQHCVVRSRVTDGGGLHMPENYDRCADNVLTGVYLLRDHHIVFCNKRFSEILGYAKDKVDGLDTKRLLVPDDKDPNWVTDERVISAITRDRKEIWLRRSLTKMNGGGEPTILGTLIDITAQKDTEEALRQSRFELEVLSNKLLQAQEEERKRIAADLHDSLGGSISAVKIGMEQVLVEYASMLPESVTLCFQHAIQGLCRTVDEVRVISMNLRPPMLDDLGLQATINWLIRGFGLLLPTIAVDTQLDIEESDLSDAQRVVVFRVLQESLNNIAKHADATKVHVELRQAENRLTLSVKDDGKGFLPPAVRTGQGFGLSSMRARVKLTAGELAIESAPGAGTLVRAVWPVSH